MGKKIEDSIKDGVTITATTMGVVYVMKTLKKDHHPHRANSCHLHRGPGERLRSLQEMDQ